MYGTLRVNKGGVCMARPLRLEYPDAWYYVLNKGRRRVLVFRNEADYACFLDLLEEASTMWNVRIAAYCLMPNHYHLLVQTPDANLARFMRHVDGVYTQRFNRSHRCDGSLFRGRYKAIVMEAATYLLKMARYVHRIPLRSKMVNRIDRYRWSSHREYLSRSRKGSWLDRASVLSMLGRAKNNRTVAYRRYMSRPDSDEIEGLFSGAKTPSVLGSPEFIAWAKEQFRNLGGGREIHTSRQAEPGLEVIRSAVSSAYETDPSELLRSHRGLTNEPRNVAIYLSRRLSGETLSRIGKAFGLDNYSSVSSTVTRVKRAMQVDRRLTERVKKLEGEIRNTWSDTN
jgi:REP element-mobilizing transposase RayT